MVAFPHKKKPAAPKCWRGNLRIVFFVAVFILGIASASVDVSSSSASTYEGKTPQVPHVQRETIHGVDVLFAEPPNDQLEGLFFVAHGCGHTNTDWFVGCEGCIGLPEERAIVQIGLDHGLVVVAVSSLDRNEKCWSLSQDTDRVGQVLQELSHRYQSAATENGKLSIFAFGISSGGYFVSALATPLKEQFGLNLKGFISQIAAVQSDQWASCQVYITMELDPHVDPSQAHALVQQVRASSIPTRHIRLSALPIRPDYFASRIPEISMEDSSKMAAALQTAGYLDENGYLLENTRESNWRDALKTSTPPIPAVFKDSLIARASPIAQVMNVAEGRHEISRDGVNEALDFCLSAFLGLHLPSKDEHRVKVNMASKSPMSRAKMTSYLRSRFDLVFEL